MHRDRLGAGKQITIDLGSLCQGHVLAKGKDVAVDGTIDDHVAAGREEDAINGAVHGDRVTGKENIIVDGLPGRNIAGIDNFCSLGWFCFPEEQSSQEDQGE